MLEKFLFKRVKDQASIRISQHTCLRSRYKWNACTICVDTCPSDAITISEEGKVVYDSKTCNDCHFCMHECPTDAIYYESEMMQKYEQRITQRDVVTYTCRKQATGSGEQIELPCLSLFTPEYLMAGELHEKEQEILCDPKKCAACEYSFDPDEGLQWVREWSNYSFTDQVMIQNDPKRIRGKKRSYNRRELFQMTSNTTKQSIGNLLIDSFYEPKSLKEKIQPPQKRKYAMVYLERKKSQFGDEVMEAVAPLLNGARITAEGELDFWHHLASICPTGALRQTSDDSGDRLLFNGRDCVNCDICEQLSEQIVRAPALSIHDYLDEVTLVERQMDQCPSCNGKKPVQRDICDDCEHTKKKRASLLDNW